MCASKVQTHPHRDRLHRLSSSTAGLSGLTRAHIGLEFVTLALCPYWYTLGGLCEAHSPAEIACMSFTSASARERKHPESTLVCRTSPPSSSLSWRNSWMYLRHCCVPRVFSKVLWMLQVQFPLLEQYHQ